MGSRAWEGRWQQVKGASQKGFGLLTEGDLFDARDSRQVMLERIQQRYALTREQAEQRLDGLR